MTSSPVRIALDRGRAVLESRTALRKWHQSQPVAPESVQVMVYFGSPEQYLYQLREWVRPLEMLAERVPTAIMVREPQVAVELRQITSLPILLARWLADMDALMAAYDPSVVLYVNQNVSNFDLLAYARPQHVFLSHGESDKVYMVSNQAKAYDRTFVAGQAAVDRYAKALHDFDIDQKLKIIGRPQSSLHAPPPADLPPTSLQQTVVYAPTTEGSGAVMEYGSLASHGVAIVSGLLASGRYRVIFRPHPQAGRRLPEHAAAIREITELLAAPGGHYVDRTPAFSWQRDAADALICDISAVAVDWLPTGKPLVVTRPSQDAAPVLAGGMLAEWPLLPADRAGAVVPALEAAAQPQEVDRMRRWADYYFAPGDTDTFIDAVVGLLPAQ